MHNETTQCFSCNENAEIANEPERVSDGWRVAHSFNSALPR